MSRPDPSRSERDQTQAVIRNRRMHFETVADLYAEVRSEYPDRVFDDAFALAGVAPPARVLEVGCGPGNATISIAERGFSVTAIEPGPRLAAHARRRCTGHDVEVVESSFEDWQADRGAFELVISVNAFHWVEPEVGFPKAADSLVAGGSLVLGFDVPPVPPPPITEALETAFRSASVGVEPADLRFTRGRLIDVVGGWFQASGRFAEVASVDHEWMEHMTPDLNTRLLATSSGLAHLEAGPRERLLAAVREELASACGDRFDLPRSMTLFHATVID